MKYRKYTKPIELNSNLDIIYATLEAVKNLQILAGTFSVTSYEYEEKEYSCLVFESVQIGFTIPVLKSGETKCFNDAMKDAYYRILAERDGETMMRVIKELNEETTKDKKSVFSRIVLNIRKISFLLCSTLKKIYAQIHKGNIRRRS